MTIADFLEHGWIQNDNIPDTLLCTPKFIADDVSYMTYRAMENTSSPVSVQF